MLGRTPPTWTLDTPASESTGPLSLPGLVSSLRPIKRISTQLNDELNLVHRFSYKNKNQHKASMWWRRVIHVDRTLHRTLGEVESLLAQFGWSKDSDEVPNVERDQVVKGLLNLPRSLILVEKSLQVLLNCASILEQLIETKAFLAFVLVIVSLIARLHSLTLVLQDELDKLGSVLLNLVEANQLSNVAHPLISRLPRELQKYILPQTRPSPSSSIPVLTTIPEPASETTSGDDTGAVIVRKMTLPQRSVEEDLGEPAVETRKKKKRTLSPEPGVPPPRAKQVVAPSLGEDTVDTGAVPKKKKRKVVPVEKEVQREVKEVDSVFPFELDSGKATTAVPTARTPGKGGIVEKKKKRETEGKEEGKPGREMKESEKRGKKLKTGKKTARKSLDEIDAIFG
ncbi:hypothetical protein JCM16303_003699 [Sporobolomyces ruberrimus]